MYGLTVPFKKSKPINAKGRVISFSRNVALAAA
nr:MAG TPA: hypothetical protein [Caudoviricetes sp.]